MELGKLDGKEAVKQARRLLCKVAQQSSLLSDKDISSGLDVCFELAHSFHQNTTSMETELSIGECAVVKGIIELIVRWGISPYLSPGVGVDRTSHSHSHSHSTPQQSSSPFSGEDVLLTSCNVLAYFATDNIDHKGFCVSFLARNYYLLDIMAGLLQVAFASPLKCPREDHTRRRNVALAKAKIEEAVATLEVGDMVETFLALIGQGLKHRGHAPSPPAWLKREAGKILSRLVIKDGGVSAVMHRLLGAGVKGDVQVYSNVAAHLAKVPKSVANSQDYYQAVCAQILPFLPYQKFTRKQSEDGETARQILCNVHHTFSLLACTMIIREPELSDTYLLKPILVHLVKWYKLQTQGSYPEDMQNEGEGQKLTETLLVQSLMQLHALLTAGHKEAKKVRKLVLEKTRPAIPALMMLHYLLETSATSEPFWTIAMPAETGLGLGKVKQDDKKGHNETEERKNMKVKQDVASFNEKRDKSTGLRKGFLDGYVSQTSDEDEDLSALGRLKVIITDLMIAHVCELHKDLTHLLLGFLSDLDLKKFRWPSTEGDIWNALNPISPRSHTPAEYLSRLLLACEKWSLVVRLMGDILRKVFNLQQSLKMQLFNEDNNGEVSPLTSVLQMMQSFETLNEVVGSKALERDSVAASTLVQNLLNERALLNDEDMVEMVLHMVYNVLNGFGSRFSEEGIDKQGKEVLICMSSSLESICSSQSLTHKVKSMSSTLNARISSLVAS